MGVFKCCSFLEPQRGSVTGLEFSVATHHVGVTCCLLTLEVALETAEKSAWLPLPRQPLYTSLTPLPSYL